MNENEGLSYKIDLLMKHYPILKQRKLVHRAINALENSHSRSILFPSTIICEYISIATKIQEIKQ